MAYGTLIALMVVIGADGRGISAGAEAGNAAEAAGRAQSAGTASPAGRAVYKF